MVTMSPEPDRPTRSEVPVTRARSEFSDLVNRAVYAGEHVVLTRHGRPVAAIVSAADLARLEELDAAIADAGSSAGTDTVVHLVGDHVSTHPLPPARDVAAELGLPPTLG